MKKRNVVLVAISIVLVASLGFIVILQFRMANHVNSIEGLISVCP